MDDDEAAIAGERLNAVYERLQEMGSATAEARAAKILHGLGASEGFELFTEALTQHADDWPEPAHTVWTRSHYPSLMAKTVGLTKTHDYLLCNAVCASTDMILADG